MAKISQILQKYVDDGSVHGVMFQAVNAKGDVLYSGSRGSLDVESKRPLPEDALCWIASMTKLVTSVAVMQLCERGLVTLDEDVSTYIPSLKNKDVLKVESDGKIATQETAKPITLRYLLSHQSGFAYPALNPHLTEWVSSVRGSDKPSSTGRLEDYDTPLVFEPGDSWLYGPGQDWAGRVVEIVSGKRLGDYMQGNIFAPLNMKNTTFHPERQSDSLPPLMEMSMRTNVDQLDSRKVKSAPMPFASPAPEDLGGIGLYSTVSDYCKLLVALLQDGGQILNADSVDEMLQPQIKNIDAFHNILQSPFRKAIVGGWDDDTQGDHSLAGTLNLNPLKGRRAANSVNWTGFPNLNWWLDKQSGIAGALFVQVLPVGDALVNKLFKELETAVYAM